MATAYPPGGTFFDTLKKSYTDVPVVGDKISTTEFLEASESLVTLFGVLCLLHLLISEFANFNRVPKTTSQLTLLLLHRRPRLRSFQARQERYYWQCEGMRATASLNQAKDSIDTLYPENP